MAPLRITARARRIRRQLLVGPTTGVVVAGAAFWLYTQGGAGRSILSGLQDLAGFVLDEVPLSSEQEAMINVIDAAARRAGLGFLGKAAVANAWAESRLNPRAVGDSGASIGLFQLNELGAGAGLSVSQRSDPEINARRIFEEALSRGASHQRGQTNAELTKWFAHEVERCAACGHSSGDSELTARVAHLRFIFGSAALSQVP